MLTVSRRLEDGAVVVVDDADGFGAVLKPGVWESLAGLPETEKRTRIEQAVLEARTQGDPRTELERTIAENESQGQGEAHQDEGRQG
jgi:hypothetical protein